MTIHHRHPPDHHPLPLAGLGELPADHDGIFVIVRQPSAPVSGETAGNTPRIDSNRLLLAGAVWYQKEAPNAAAWQLGGKNALPPPTKESLSAFSLGRAASPGIPTCNNF